MTSHVQLPVARQITSMPATREPFPYIDIPDMSGQVTRRAQRAHPPSSAPALSAPQPAAFSASGPSALSVASAGTSMSRTTQWRKRKAAELLAQQQGLPPTQQPPRKEYTCGQCGQPRRKEFGHTRVGSLFFCATAEGKTLEEWLKER